MAKSPTTDKECVDCSECITRAEHRRNGYQCDKCVRKLTKAVYDWKRGRWIGQHVALDFYIMRVQGIN